MPELIIKNFKKILMFSSIGLLFGIIVVYSFFKMKDVIVGVELNVSGIVDGQTLDTPKIDIHGNAKNIKTVTINDRLITIAQDGSFNDTVLALPGYNIVSIKGDDKFGKHIAKNYHVFLKNDQTAMTALLQNTGTVPPEHTLSTN